MAKKELVAVDKPSDNPRYFPRTLHPHFYQTPTK